MVKICRVGLRARVISLMGALLGMMQIDAAHANPAEALELPSVDVVGTTLLPQRTQPVQFVSIPATRLQASRATI